MPNALLFSVGVIAMLGGFGGTLTFKHAGFAIGGGAGAVITVVSFIMPG